MTTWGASFIRTLVLTGGLLVLPVSLRAADHAPGHAAPTSPPAPKQAEIVSPAGELDALTSTNLLHPEPRAKVAAKQKDYRHEIDTARRLRRQRDFGPAASLLMRLLEEELPPEFKRGTLFELALVAQDQKQLPRAQQILAQYAQMFPQDPTIPEVLLRQGLIFRQMGAHQMAVAKFYGVMNTALGLKLEQFDYYKRLVLQAQTEIADTHYLQGKFDDAVDLYKRILKQDTMDLNRPQVRFKYIRCLAGLARHSDVVVQCEAFFAQHPAAAEEPELRFLCAQALKQLGRSKEALQQVLRLLESQEPSAQANPENWVYWQQRTGNDVANQLYAEGDYLGALELYNHLRTLNPAPAWQLPVSYQTGLIYERLGQPEKAVEIYGGIAAREKELTASAASPSVKTVIEMAKWRKDHLQWHGRAEVAVQSLHLKPVPASPSTTLLSTNTSSQIASP